MTQDEVRALLVQTGAIMDGHFLLTSGLHSPHYVEKFNVLQHPQYTQQLCEAMAEKFKDARIETGVGPVTGGILLAHETGKALGTRAIFTERVDGKMTFRRGFSLREGERVLIVEDIVTTGGSIKEVIALRQGNPHDEARSYRKVTDAYDGGGVYEGSSRSACGMDGARYTAEGIGWVYTLQDAAGA